MSFDIKTRVQKLIGGKIMKKRFITLIAMLCMIVLLVPYAPAYADYSQTGGGHASLPRSVTVPYGMTYHVFDANQYDTTYAYDQTIKNNQTLGTFTLSSDARIHRFKIKFWFEKSGSDTGPSGSLVKVTFKLTRGNGTIQTYIVEPGVGNIGIFDSEWYTSYPGEQLTFWVDVSTATGYSGNGNYRTAYFYDFQVYCD